MRRRDLLRTALVSVASAGLSTTTWAQYCPPTPNTVRDRLWLFAVPANSDFIHLHLRSRMSPVEGALYFSIPNIIVVQASTKEAQYGKFEPPFEQYATAMRPFKRIAWSVVGSGGVASPEERKQVIELAKKEPNFVGLYLDDFFFPKPKEGRQAVLTPQQVADIRRQAKDGPKKLDLLVTLYSIELGLPLNNYLSLMDVILLWTEKPSELVNLESNLKRVHELAPGARRMLGCYLVDYETKSSISVSAMRDQCEAGLHWLRQGQIEGIVFLGNIVEDLGFEAVEWTREWIQKVGNIKI